MSYFDDYMNGEGKRTLRYPGKPLVYEQLIGSRCYSKPMDLKQFGDDRSVLHVLRTPSD